DNIDAPVHGYLGAGFVQVVLDGPCLDSKTHALARDPTALIDWLETNRWLKVSDPLPINLAGYSGLRVEVSQAKSPKGACDYSKLTLPEMERAEIASQVTSSSSAKTTFMSTLARNSRSSCLIWALRA